MPETQEFVHLLPLLKGIPAACLLALLLAGPLTLEGLTRATGYTAGRVGDALDTLATLGLVAAAGETWAAGESLAASLPRLDFAAPGRGVSETQSQESLTFESASLPSPGSQTRPLVTPDSKPMTPDSETPDSATGEDCQVEKILALSGELLGEPVLLPSGFRVTSHELLAQVAEAFINRARLRYPARVVASNLKNHRPASRRFWATPRAYLPAGFLRRLDAALADCQAEADAAAEDEAATGEEPRPESSPTAAIPPTPPSPSQRLWLAARDELQRSLPKASYESYVSPLAVVDYDPEQRQLFLEAPDGPSCRWLDGHLKRILERLMVGITGEAVDVVFLPPEAGDEGGAA